MSALLSQCPHCGNRSLWRLDWVIVGGESGHRARPFNIQWARDIIQQCKAADVPIFVKQLGALPYDDGSQPAGGWWPDQKAYYDDLLNGEQVRFRRLKDKKGGSMPEWPEDIRVREFPQETANVQ